MSCETVIEKLQGYVLGALSADDAAEVRAHLAECADCRAEEEFYRLLVDEVRLTAKPGPLPEGLEQRTVAAARSEMARQRRRRIVRRAAVAVAGMAAVILLALWLQGSPTGRSAPVRWRFAGAPSTPGALADGLVVAGGRMYILETNGAHGRVAAVDLGTGATLWHSQASCMGYLAADEVRAYCLSSDGPDTIELLALDAASGREIWRYSQQRSRRLLPACPPVPLGAGRVCWTHEGSVHVVDSETGAPLWRREIDGERTLSGAVARGATLYIAGDRALHCLDAATGAERWSDVFDGRGGALKRPLLAQAGGGLYVARACSDGGANVLCVDPDARRVTWKQHLPTVTRLLATREAVYLRSERIAALEAATGGRIWTRSAEGCGPLTLIDGLLHFVDTRRDGNLVAVKPQSGEPAWHIAGLRSCDAFTKVGDTGYIKTQDGVVLALALGERRYADKPKH